MQVTEQIAAYIASQPEAKRADMQALHGRILATLPGCKLWYESGKNEEGKIVSNPNIGYGQYTIQYADGKTRDFFQIGLSANTTGLSVYIMGLKDKGYLEQNYADTIGKASVTGYCIKFKKLADIDVDVLMNAVQNGVQETG